MTLTEKYREKFRKLKIDDGGRGLNIPLGLDAEQTATIENFISRFTTALREELEKNARKDLEANELDGDSIDDCGGAKFSPAQVLEWFDNYISSVFGEKEK